MLSDETLRAAVEGIIYVAQEPVSLDAIARSLEGEDHERVKLTIESLVQHYDGPEHGICIRHVAGGYKFASKPEHHEIFRRFVRSLMPAVRLSKPALETLAVIAYRQPVTLPEIEAIRGVDCGGVIHTLMEKKLVMTAGRKAVVGRPILYKTSREFLVHFGLKSVGDLPSLREFEELARQALGQATLETPAEATGANGRSQDAAHSGAPEATHSGQGQSEAPEEGATQAQRAGTEGSPIDSRSD